MGFLEAHKVLPKGLRDVLNAGGVDLQSEDPSARIKALAGVVFSFMLCCELVTKAGREEKRSLLSFLQDQEGLNKVVGFLASVVDVEVEDWRGCEEKGYLEAEGAEDFLGKLCNAAFLKGLEVSIYTSSERLFDALLTPLMPLHCRLCQAS